MKRSRIKTNNPVLAAALVVIIASSMSVTGIFAYLTARGSAANMIRAGNSVISIQEDFSNPDIEPGEITDIAKRVTVRNAGINYTAVRVRAEFSDSGAEEWTEVDYNTEDWHPAAGGYWYYKTPLAPGDSTSPLFTRVRCLRPTADQAKDFEIYVYAESRNCNAGDSADAIRSSFA